MKKLQYNRSSTLLRKLRLQAMSVKQRCKIVQKAVNASGMLRKCANSYQSEQMFKEISLNVPLIDEMCKSWLI